MVTSGELRAGGALVGDTLGQCVRVVRDVHQAVAGRVFGSVTHAAAPVQLLHDAIAGTAYGTTQVAHVVLPRIGAAAAAPFAPADAPSLSARPAGRLALGAINGLWGDRLERRYPALALPMALRAEGSDVPLSAEGVARAYPEATRSLAVFVHGLCESEESWSLAAESRHGDRRITYGSLLREDLGFTPLYVRYNTGRCIADNARGLAELLEQLVAVWPVPVEEIVLVGHSMGGLVIRGACHTADEAGWSWTASVRHVFCLGTPHLGARLERGVAAAASALDRLPETRPAARWLDARSAGVKDLRHGACVDDDAHGHDAAGLVRMRRAEVPFLEHASYYFVAATLVRDSEHPAADWVGDLLVHLASASGSGEDRHLPFPVENGAHFGGMHHFDLLNHPAVYEQLKRWIARDRLPR